MRKGFIFTLDAVFAASILLIALAAISLEFYTPSQTFWLPTMGNSLMTALDKSGVFNSIFQQSDAQAQTTLTSYLASLPPNVNANITVKIYHGSGDTFTLSRTITAIKGVPDPNHETTVKRIFNNVAGSYFGLSEMVLSYG